ncbi:T9SS type A sorting domain-containing protein [uncultured Polaribacter sp.]|uniref:T9SS type A sorting domain-containing protein n=1 Tax=uncultured Polaribacter sp. TaxID=174711 RepID=UPI00263850B1|nr:T9SS type A sorting domain-containing protein [uncultured Polaribacter sp.]
MKNITSNQMLKQTFTFLVMFMLLLISATTASYAQCADTSATGDCDGDGITNEIDLDDDNDGIFDIVECPTEDVFEYNLNIFSSIALTQTTSCPAVNFGAIWFRQNPTYYIGSPNDPCLDPFGTTGVITDHTTGSTNSGTVIGIQAGSSGTTTFNFLTVLSFTETVLPNREYEFGLAHMIWGREDLTTVDFRGAIQILVNGTVIETLQGGAGLAFGEWEEDVITINSGNSTTLNIEIRVRRGQTSSGNDYLLDDITLRQKAGQPLCDADEDGVPNIHDLDSDNDGILDTAECAVPEGNITSGNGTTTLSGDFTSPSGASSNFSIVSDHNTNQFNNGVISGLQLFWNQGNNQTHNMTISIDQATNGSLYGIRVGSKAPNVNTILSQITKDINITWPGGTEAIIFDPNNEITGFTTGDRIDSGQVLTIAGGLLVNSNWSIFIDLSGVNNFPIDIGFNSNSVPGQIVSEAMAFDIILDCDSDNDGLSNIFDLDSDNDGIPDNVEAQTTIGYVEPSGIGAGIADANDNGVDDNYENGTIIGITPEDTDNDNEPDFLDTDTDNDGILDIQENGDTTNNSILDITADADNDGINDIFDDNDDAAALGSTVNDGVGANDTVTGSTSLEDAFNDEDGDFNPGNGDLDFRDLVINAVNDAVTVIEGLENINVLDVLLNDTIAGVQATTSNTDLTQLSTINAGVTVNNSGQVNVASNVPDGVYVINYQICESGTSNCEVAVVSVTVLNDNDGDQIPDTTDLDDDNDGILDTNEGYTAPSLITTPTVIDFSNVTSGSATTGNLGVIESCNNVDLSANYNFTQIIGDAPNLRVDTGSNQLVIDYVGTSGTALITYTFSQNVNVTIGLRSNNSNESVTFITPYDNIIPGPQSTIVNAGPPVVWNNNNDPNQTFFEFIGVSSVTLGIEGDNLVQRQTITVSNFTGNASCTDSDGDTFPNFLDSDSDNDGIPDNVEAQTTAGYIEPSGIGTGITDSNDNGVDDNYENASGTGLTPINTDNSDEPDFLDTDTDNDGIPDIEENGDAINNSILDNNADADGDGINDIFDDNDDAATLGSTVNDGVGANDTVTDSTSLEDAFNDQDGDFNPGNGDLDFRDDENNDNDGDGISDAVDLDDDNDGILDTEEGQCTDIVIPGANGFLATDINDVARESDAIDGINDQSASLFRDGSILQITLRSGSAPVQAGTNIAIVSEIFDVNSGNIMTITESTDGVNFVNPQNITFTAQNIFITTNYTLTTNATDIRITYTEVSSNLNIDNVSYSAFTEACNTSIDTDGDGIPDYLDLDSDNDGIPDNVEAQTTAGYIEPSGIGTGITDANNNGVDDNYENGTVIGISPEDTDNDNEPDFLDTDTDNDGILDIQENGDTTNNSILDITADADSDGINDIFDDNDDTATLGSTVNDGVGANDTVTDSTSLEDAFNDEDGDFNPGNGDLDFRDSVIADDIMITQVYQFGTERWIEITNISSANTLPANTINIQLYKDRTTEPLGVLPDVTLSITSAILPGQSVLIRNSANTITNTTPSTPAANAIIIENNALTDIADGDDIITISSSGNESSWSNRFDVVSNIENNTSLVRIDETLIPNITFATEEWITFIDDSILPFGNPLADPNDGRHPHAPLVSEVINANTNANTLLGLHRINVTTRTANNWSNGAPDRSRAVVINEDYNHNSGTLSARELTVNNNTKLGITDNLLVVTNDVVLNGEIRLIDASSNSRAQFIQTHESASLVTAGSNGKLLVDQNSTVPSIYRFNYIGSPVKEVSGAATYTIGNVLKDGTTPTNFSGTINTTIAKNINFVGGYDGDTQDPIQLANYWLFSFAPANGAVANWIQKGSNGVLGNADGFIFKGPGRAQNYTFLGVPKDGNITSNIGASESYLIANPYASALSVKEFIEDNLDATTGVLYFWEHVSELDTSGPTTGHNFAGYIGGYATRNITTGVSAINVAQNGSGPKDITLPANTATITNGLLQTVLDGATNINVASLTTTNSLLTFTNIPSSVENLIIRYRTTSLDSVSVNILENGNGVLKKNGTSVTSLKIPSSSTFRTFEFNACVVSGSDISIINLDSLPIEIEYLNAVDTDGLVACAPNVGTPGTFTYRDPEPYVAIGQGFFVGGDNDGGSITFNNSQRQYVTEGTGNSIFFKAETKARKSAKTSENETATLPIIKLGMDFKNEIDNRTYHRQIAVSFSSFTSFSYDKGYDAQMFDTGTTDIYWKFPSLEGNFVITGVQSISDELEIPLELKMSYSGTVDLMIDELKNVPAKNLYIIDKVTGDSYEISKNSITLNLAEGTYTDRFFLAFKPLKTLTVNEEVISAFTNMYVDNNNNTVVVTKKEQISVNKVQLYDILGKEIASWKINEQQEKYELKINKKLPTGFYIINVKTDKGKSNRKVLIE